MIGGGETVFSHDQTCFSRPPDYANRDKGIRGQPGAPDRFTASRIVRYNYHDALYHCARRHMRLPTVEELKALVAYANTGNGMASAYAIVASKGDSRYPGGLYGWGGGSPYWTNTFAGSGFRKVVDLSSGRVGIDSTSHRAYVSCVR